MPLGKPGLDVGAAGLVQRQAARVTQPRLEAGQVAPVGGQGVGRQAVLEPDGIQEGVDVRLVGGGRHAAIREGQSEGAMCAVQNDGGGHCPPPGARRAGPLMPSTARLDGALYCSVMFCFCTTSRAQSYCARISLANSSGVLPDGEEPCSSSALITLGSLSATTAASRSLLTMSIGVPAGASRPYQTGWFSSG